jgi:hypothetical protein
MILSSCLRPESVSKEVRVQRKQTRSRGPWSSRGITCSTTAREARRTHITDRHSGRVLSDLLPSVQRTSPTASLRS